MKIKICILFILFLPGLFIYTNSLSYKLNKIVKNKEAKICVSVFGGNKLWNTGCEKLPLLSVFKYFIALKILNMADNKTASLDQKLIITEDMTDKTLYSPMLQDYKSYPFEITLSELLEYMVSKSDNNACDILIDFAGGTKEIEKFIHNLGFNDIEIKVNEKEMNKDIKKQYLNKAYPKDVLRLMKNVKDGHVLSNSSSVFLDKIMIKTTTGKDKLKAGLPYDVVMGHKTGSSSRLQNGVKIADNDAGFAILPDGRTYYIVVMISNSKMQDSENARIISKISKTVYEHFTK